MIFFPIPCTYPKFRRLGGVARIIIYFRYMETLNHANYREWLHFLYLPPYTRERMMDDAGIEPGPPAWQATALSITPCLSGG